jgi:hypothetical protein
MSVRNRSDYRRDSIWVPNTFSKGSIASRSNLGAVLLNDGIALASDPAQFLAIENFDGAAIIFDDLISLEQAGSVTDARAVAAEHVSTGRKATNELYFGVRRRTLSASRGCATALVCRPQNGLPLFFVWNTRKPVMSLNQATPADGRA